MKNNFRKIDLRSLTKKEVKELVEALSEKPFRAKQLFEWIQKGVNEFEQMSNMPKSFREKLEANCILSNVKAIQVLDSSKDATKKFLFSLSDGNIIESVFMKYKHGNSVCVSTQVGCNMGCTFCASTIDGMARNLLSGEIIGQIMEIQNITCERVSNIVLMGSGESLDNFDEVVRFLKLVNDEESLNISMRSITLSTCGIVPKIIKLADLELQLTLAISLHAFSDEKRSETMPINKKYDIKSLIEACKYYVKKTGRRITFEYALIEGKNDLVEDAKGLIKVLRGLNCHINLIPINEVKERGYRPAKAHNINKFKELLEKEGLTVTVRRELGSDINAACGQLRKSHLDQK
ncbi:MAG: 23S rRNA (adenine(2503)-C(2))-methyltransferase RlmN [Acidaminobacteraceae bacterium]